MPTKWFGFGDAVVEVTTLTEDALAAVICGAQCVQGRWHFQGSTIVVDFARRVVTESRLATLTYRVLVGGKEVFSASGLGARRVHSLQSTLPGQNVFRF